MNNDNNENNGSSELERFFGAITGVGGLLMGLAMFGIIFGNSGPPTITITVPVGNKSAEVNSSIKQTGFLNVNFGDAKGENRND